MASNSRLQEVSILKNVLFLIIFIGLILVMYFNVIMVSINEYKDMGENIKRHNRIVKKAQKEHDYHNNILSTLKSSNRKLLKATINQYTAFEVGKYLGSNFSYFDIQNTTEATLEDNFKYIELDIKVTTKSIKNFYRFMQQINSSSNIIKVDFPLQLKAVNKNIEIRFKLKIYTFKRLEL